MKRLSLAAPILGALLLGVSPALAAHPYPGGTTLNTRLSKATAYAIRTRQPRLAAAARVLTSRASRAARPQRAFTNVSRHPLAVTRSRAAITASDLGLPSDVVSQAGGTQSEVAAGQGPFSNYHKSYTGFQSGIAAQIDFQPIMTLFYQGSIFSDTASAQNYMTESVNTVNAQSGASSSDCSTTEGVPCQIITFAASASEIVLYAVAQVNYCVIETGYQGDPTQISANSDTVSQATAAAFATGITEAKNVCAGSGPTASPNPSPTPTPSPTTVSYSMVKVQWIKGSAKASDGPTQASFSKGKGGTKVQLVGYYNVTSAPPSEPVTITWTISKSGAQIATKTLNGTLDATNPTGGYDAYVTWNLPKKTGSYVGTVTVSIAGQSQSGTATIKDVKKKKKA